MALRRQGCVDDESVSLDRRRGGDENGTGEAPVGHTICAGAGLCSLLVAAALQHRQARIFRETWIAG
jgi:hypothetical protein